MIIINADIGKKIKIKIRHSLYNVNFIVFIGVNLSALRKKENRQYISVNVNKTAKLKSKRSFLVWMDLLIKCFCTTAVFKDYFALEFYDKTIREARTFLTYGRWWKARRFLSTPDIIDLLNNKKRYLETFRDYTKREYYYIDDSTDTQALAVFTGRHPKFVAKPNRLFGGKGIELVDSGSFTDTDSLLSCLRSNETLLLEEPVVNHRDIMKFSKSSLNTTRIVSIRTEDGVKVIYAILRFNLKGGFTDNLTSGGYICPVNPATGKLYRGMTYAINESEPSNIYIPDHPSGFFFEGEQLPLWDEVVDLVTKATLALKDAFFVAWDMAITDDGPVIIEGNSYPPYQIVQSVTGVGYFRDIQKAYKYGKKCLKKK